MLDLIEKDKPTSDDQWVNLVVRRMKLAETARKSHESKWLKSYKYYKAYRKFDADYWWRSQLFIPYIFSIIESICPWLIEALVGGESFFGVSDPWGEFPENAERTQKLMQFQLEEKIKYFLRVVSWVKNTLIYGTSIVKLGWWKKEKDFRFRKWDIDRHFGIVTGSHMETETRTVYDDPIMDTVALENFFPDPYGEDIESCGYVIERHVKDFDYLRTMEQQGIYQNVEKVKDTHFEGIRPEFEKLSEVGESIPTEGSDRKRQLVELLEYQEDDRFITVANRRVLVRPARPNPFDHMSKTYAMLKDYPMDKEFWAISTTEMLVALQDKLNDLENLRIDNLFQALNRMYIVQRHRGLKADQFVSRPYGLIWSDDIQAVKPLEQATLPGEAFAEGEQSLRNMERVSGAWEYAAGMTPQRRETATGIVRLQEAALRRFGLKIKIFQRTGFKESLEQIMQLDQQLLPEGYPLIGEGEPIRLNPWDIQGKFALKITASSDLVGERERFMALYERAAGDPYFEQYKLREKLLDTFRLPGARELLVKAEVAQELAGGMLNMGMSPGEVTSRLPQEMGV